MHDTSRFLTSSLSAKMLPLFVFEPLDCHEEGVPPLQTGFALHLKAMIKTRPSDWKSLLHRFCLRLLDSCLLCTQLTSMTVDHTCALVCNTEYSQPTATRVEENSKYIAFGIVAGIIILVVVNVLICIARCLLAPRIRRRWGAYPNTDDGEDGSVAWFRSGGGSVYVVNPGGSLKIGKRDMKKGLEGSGGDDNDDPADVCEQGLSQEVGDEELQERTPEGGVEPQCGCLIPRS